MINWLKRAALSPAAKQQMKEARLGFDFAVQESRKVAHDSSAELKAWKASGDGYAMAYSARASGLEGRRY